jgi:undecaprenyl-diphosphatase
MQTASEGSPNFWQKWKRPFFRQITRTGEMESWAIVMLLVWIVTDRFPDAPSEFRIFLQSGRAVAVTWVLTLILKKIFRRQRPKTFDAILFPKLVVNASFPSAHSSTVFAMFVALLLRPDFPLGLAIVVGIWATLVAYSRVVLGVHYVSDVMGGAAVGAIGAYGVHLFLSSV